MDNTLDTDKLFELIPDIGEQMGSIDSVLDEQFPHISKIILYLWGSEECLAYIEELLNFIPTPERPFRKGFPFQALKELLIVMEYHNSKFPYMRSATKARKENFWWS